MDNTLTPKYFGKVEVYCNIDELDRQMEFDDKMWNVTKLDGSVYIQNRTCNVRPSLKRRGAYFFAGLIVHVADVRRWYNEGKIAPIK